MPVKSLQEKAAIYDIAMATMADALHDACKKYPTDVESALIFFVTAIGLTRDAVTEDDLKWAVEQVRQIEKAEGRIIYE